jgi:hypothetical protein
MTRPIETTTIEKRRSLRLILKGTPGNRLEQQRARIIQALELGTLNTSEAQSFLRVYDPPARVCELRHVMGFKIKTHMMLVQTSLGDVHRLGVYVLTRGGKP